MEHINRKLSLSRIAQYNPIGHIDINWNYHSNGILQILKDKQPNYELTEVHKIALKYFLQHFTGMKEFESNVFSNGKNGDLNKGILLIGNVGSGKSLIFEVFKQYTLEVIKRNGFIHRYASEIIDEVGTYGVTVLDEYFHNFQGDNKQPKPMTVYIDDLWNQRDEVNNYGTKINVMEKLMDIRYNVYQRYNVRTYASTNMYFKDLKEIRIDKRVLSRMYEMFNVLELNSKNFRM